MPCRSKGYPINGVDKGCTQAKFERKLQMWMTLHLALRQRHNASGLSPAHN